MTPGPKTLPPEAVRFRRRLLGTMLAAVAVGGAIVLAVARARIAADVEDDFDREFQAALATLHHVSELRHAALLERNRALARRSRIHAALEDDALDLLYPSARDELRDTVSVPDISDGARPAPPSTLHARFYRFLDANGAVIAPAAGDDACGPLSPAAEARLALPRVPAAPQTGYLAPGPDDAGVAELVATPIISTETGAPIAGLVLGFEPIQLSFARDTAGDFVSGIWVDAHLGLPGLPPEQCEPLLTALRQRANAPDFDARAGGRLRLSLGGAPQMVFYKMLNPGSLFPPAFEVCVFPLAAMHARQRQATWQVLGAGAILLLAGYAGSAQLARRFAKPVAVLAHDSREQRVQRQRVEAALETTSAELERVARFSADASHQLKTPVTVLRAGLDEILARGAVPPAEAEEIATLIHQTYRLSTIIDDLLLLARLDAGQLRIQAGVVDLAGLIEASLDDLSATPDDFELAVESEFPRPLAVAGEKRYVALILQNLLENARKYNRPGGNIRVAARPDHGNVITTVGNTTRRPIPPDSQPHIFERFHRGAMGENVPGYGIGLNLARELARLHDGDLRLVRSDEAWTEFELTLRRSPS